MIQLAKFIPWLPAVAAILCGLCCLRKPLRGLAAPICIAGIFAAFILSVLVSTAVQPLDLHQPVAELNQSHQVHGFEWIIVGDSAGAEDSALTANFSFLIDPLTVIMLFVVTGIGTLVAIYAAGYMKGDPGYARFFAAVSLFIFAMSCLVLADNLVLLYLGWEGVGLCSYLLIGFYYQKPAAVAAAKKAFIVNRIGDLGFALGIFLTWQTFGSVSLLDVVHGAAQVDPADATTAMYWIPFLLMLGAFGKSAQIPLYVWLPDAMEGPTPVSALIHAATMVTAGVYMIARLLPVFELSPAALPTVATVGACTAFFAATIAMFQNDLKKVFAYSTISQLGYMFLGVGALSAVGGVFHLFTHAFFKALLFLTAGSVMHACAGQLDLRKLSGLRHKMPITCWLMFTGCIALAGVPFVAAGFYSKDMILAEALSFGLDHGSSLFIVLAAIGVITALMTAYYTFRLWFRVFMGPEHFVMGDEHHDAHDSMMDTHVVQDVAHHHEPHEMSPLMNAPLFVLAAGAILAGAAGGWIASSIGASTAVTAAGMAEHAAAAEEHHATVLGLSAHAFMILVSFVASLGGIAIAAYFHWFRRPAADALAARNRSLVRLLENKWLVDEFYHAAIVKPLHMIGQLSFIFDRLIIDGLVMVVGFVPGLAGRMIQPAQRGALQGYGLGMAVGVAVLLLLVIFAAT